jgi:hypothetical protein
MLLPLNGGILSPPRARQNPSARVLEGYWRVSGLIFMAVSPRCPPRVATSVPALLAAVEWRINFIFSPRQDSPNFRRRAPHAGQVLGEHVGLARMVAPGVSQIVAMPAGEVSFVGRQV